MWVIGSICTSWPRATPASTASSTTSSATRRSSTRPTRSNSSAPVVDQLDADVYAFGLLTDFRGRLFPGSARFMELADERQELQVEARCWCGERATMNAGPVHGRASTTELWSPSAPPAEGEAHGRAPGPAPLAQRRNRPARLGDPAAEHSTSARPSGAWSSCVTSRLADSAWVNGT